MFLHKNDVLICIAAYIEAAIYSGVEITVHSTVKDDLNEKFLCKFYSNSNLHDKKRSKYSYVLQLVSKVRTTAMNLPLLFVRMHGKFLKLIEFY